VDATTGQPIEGALVTLSVGDEHPGADYKLLVPLKRSPAYRAIRPRVADLKPADAWTQDDLHFFTFKLRSLNGDNPSELPVAVFAMHPELTTPVSALLVNTHAEGQAPEIVDLLSQNGAVHA
jgi:hypothetical protein